MRLAIAATPWAVTASLGVSSIRLSSEHQQSRTGRSSNASSKSPTPRCTKRNAPAATRFAMSTSRHHAAADGCCGTYPRRCCSDLERSFRHRTCGQPIADAKLLTATVMRRSPPGFRRDCTASACRVGQLNALRVFRDTTDSSANRNLWGRVGSPTDGSLPLPDCGALPTRGGIRVGRQVGFPPKFLPTAWREW